MAYSLFLQYQVEIPSSLLLHSKAVRLNQIPGFQLRPLRLLVHHQPIPPPNMNAQSETRYQHTPQSDQNQGVPGPSFAPSTEPQPAFTESSYETPKGAPADSYNTTSSGAGSSQDDKMDSDDPEPRYAYPIFLFLIMQHIFQHQFSFRPRPGTLDHPLILISQTHRESQR